jgi:cobalt transporter subunit CbtA
MMIAGFRHLVFAALCAGLVTGVLTTAAHQIGTVPLILQAETFEQKPAAGTPHDHAATAHDHAAPAPAEWEPQGWTERAVYTALADILAATGFALLLTAGFALRGGVASWREGLFWGLAGFATFTLAPCLGLPPELPGSEAAPLLQRQLWWLAAAGSTGAALALLAFTERAGWAVLAAVLLVLPHLYGAPQTDGHAASGPPETLTRQFVVAVTVISLLFWLSLGAASGYFYRRFDSQIRAG